MKHWHIGISLQGVYVKKSTTVQMYSKYTINFLCYTDIPNVEHLGIHIFLFLKRQWLDIYLLYFSGAFRSFRLSSRSGFPKCSRTFQLLETKKYLKRISAKNNSVRTRNRLLLVVFTDLKRQYNNEKTTAKLTKLKTKWTSIATVRGHYRTPFRTPLPSVITASIE